MGKSIEFAKLENFSLDAKVQEWHRRIVDSVSTHKHTREKSVDYTIKMVYLLGIILFTESFGDSKCRPLKENVRREIIKLNEDEEPIKTVLAIANIIAKESEISKVVKMVSLFHNIMS